jgi:hypothetical protein
MNVFTFVSIAVIAGGLGVYFAFRRARARTGIMPSSRLQEELGLYAENRSDIRLNPDLVPADLRQLIPLAQKWGIGDDIIRNDLIDKSSDTEKQELHDALFESDERITEWLSSLPPGEISDEAAAFMHMGEAIAEMGYFLDEEKSGQPPLPPVESPRHIGAKRVEPIPAPLFAKLNRITPSRDRDMLYYPCRVVTRDGRVFDRVYVQPREPYLTYWGILPFDDRHKGWIAISEVVDLEESPLRLPPQLAERVYEKGETGMGYTSFRMDFRNGNHRAVTTGGTVDFIPLREGETGADVVRVHTGIGRLENTDLAPRYYWSIYEGVA